MFATRAAWAERFADWLDDRRRRHYPAIALAFALATWWLGPQFTTSMRVDGDFIAFYTAADLQQQGRHEQLYDLRAQAAAQAAPPGRRDQLDAFLNPPHFALMLRPLAALPYGVAVACWWVLLVACALAAVTIARRELPGLKQRPARSLGWAFVTFFPFVTSLGSAQTTAFTLLVLTGVFVLLRRRADVAAGAVLGLLSFKPQLMIAILVALIAARRWRALGTALAVSAAAVALGELALPGSTRAFLRLARAMPEYVTSQGYKTAGQQSLFGLVFLLGGPIAPSVARYAGFVLTGAGALLLGWHWLKRPWQPGTREWDGSMAVTFAATVLLSPHLFVYDLLLLALPLGIALHLFPGRVRDRPLDGGPLLAWSALLWIACLVGPPLAHAQQRLLQSAGLAPFAVQMVPIVVVIWIAVLWHQIRASAENDAPGASEESVRCPDSPDGHRTWKEAARHRKIQ